MGSWRAKEENFGLAKLQIESISRSDSILNSGARDLSTDVLLTSIDPFPGVGCLTRWKSSLLPSSDFRPTGTEPGEIASKIRFRLSEICESRILWEIWI